MFVSGYRCVAFDVRKTVQSQTGIVVWLQVCGVCPPCCRHRRCSAGAVSSTCPSSRSAFATGHPPYPTPSSWSSPASEAPSS